MFDRILRRIQQKVRTVEHVLLTGEIVERQKDYRTGEWKYLVEGRTSGSDVVIVVTKLSLTGKLVIITIYVE